MAGLKVKDILLHPTDFDPTTLYVPNVISQETEKWEATLSLEDFRTFWHRERTAIQFVHRSEGGCNCNLLKGDPDDLLPIYKPTGYGGSIGAPKRNDWSFRFSCRRHKRSTNLSIDRESVGAGCPVETRMTKPVGKEAVNVSYKWKHNHDDSGSARSQIPLGRNELSWTMKQAHSGMKWASIRGLLRPNKASIRRQRARKVKGPTPPLYYIKYSHVRSAVYRARTSGSRKSINPTTSVKLWMEQIKKEGGKGIFVDNVTGITNQYFFAWSTEFQLEVMSSHSGIVCMDSTHKTVRSLLPDPDDHNVFPSAFLFTLLVRDRTANAGIPVAFMICNSESKNTLRTWLTWVRDQCGLNASKFMVDCSQTETEALRQAFSTLDIYYCSFHVAQAWERKAKEYHGVDVCNAMRLPLKDIRIAKSEAERVQKWDDFLKAFPKCKKMINYLKTWMTPEKVEKWALYLRKNYQLINTNNLVETWHKTLKRHHLGSRRNLRPDDLVHLLQGVVDVDFQQKLFQITEGFVDPPLSAYDARRKKEAANLDFNVASLMVKLLPLELKFEVKSFAVADASYSIRSNKDFTSIMSCTCADYCRHQIPCKHMYLVQRFYKSVKVFYTGEPSIAPEQHLQDMEILGPNLEAGLGPLIRLQLDRKRAAEQEVERVAREMATRQEFEDNEGLLAEIMKQMATVVEARNKRKCTLEHLKVAVSTAKNTLLEIQGLNTAQAGQRCQK